MGETLSSVELLNILELGGDKIQKKTNPSEVYPIYNKDRFCTIHSGYCDNDHLVFATK